MVRPMAVRCRHCGQGFRARRVLAAHVEGCRVAALEREVAELREVTHEVIASSVQTALALMDFEPPVGSEPH